MEDGDRLLRESAARSAKMNASVSCTVHFNGRLRAIHDGDWVYCDGGCEFEDFVRDVCDFSGGC